MSKKDTVIIAILLNAGLLIVLFATSLKSDPSGGESQTHPIVTPALQKEEQIVSVPPSKEAEKPPIALSGDEVDQMIKQYATPQAALAPVEVTPNFADDVQAIGGLSLATPAPAQQTITSEETAYKEVKVKKGDVLEKIARLNHVTVDEIMQTNKMTNTRLKIGQVLKIPTKSKKETVTQSLKPVIDSAQKLYTIKNGDNLWAIAVKNHMKMEDLLKLNNLTEEKARHLKPGDQIKIK